MWVLKEFREYVAPSNAPIDFIDNTLLPMAASYGEIIGASYESTSGAENVNNLLRWLDRIDNRDWVPPAILYFSEYHGDPELLLWFLEHLERLAAGMMIMRYNINQRIERYGRVLRAIEKDEELFDTDSPLQLAEEERKTIVERLNGDVYNMRARLPILLRLDEALSEGEASYDYKIISVEHVLPQNPPLGSQWLEWFPNEEERVRYTHCLGNLVLLSRKKNSQARNYEFEKKKHEYFARKSVSPFALTTQVLQEKEWTPEVVKKRQKMLLDHLREVWKL